VLIVHVVVVLLPISVLAALILVAVPATRRPFSLLALLIAFLACVAIPFAFLSGSALERRIGSSPLINTHVALAHQLLVLAVIFGLAFAAFVAVDLLRRAHRGQLNDLERRAVDAAPAVRRYAGNHTLTIAYRCSAAALVVLAIVTGVQVYRVGDAGARAAWSGRLPAANVQQSP
jgi:hypothetical protein